MITMAYREPAVRKSQQVAVSVSARTTPEGRHPLRSGRRACEFNRRTGLKLSNHHALPSNRKVE